ncbi:MAG: hypothetical protein IH886_10645 [Nitrospinae bacterium]|nr:hypothetical protein [Nitrospinota bacterium]
MGSGITSKDILIYVVFPILVAAITGWLHSRYKSKDKGNDEFFQPPDLTPYEDEKRILKFKYPTGLGTIMDLSVKGVCAYGIFNFLMPLAKKNLSKGDYEGLQTFAFIFLRKKINCMHLELKKVAEKDWSEKDWETYLLRKAEALNKAIYRVRNEELTGSLKKISVKVGDSGSREYYVEIEAGILWKKGYMVFGAKEMDGILLEARYMVDCKYWVKYRESIKASFESATFSPMNARRVLASAPIHKIDEGDWF